MSWRTVVISSRCKLDTKMGYMVIRAEEVHRIFLDEIAIVIIENPAVAMTGCLLSELIQRKIKVIFCDSSHMPQSELVPYYGSHDTSRKLRVQIGWKEMLKGAVWGDIIAQKIYQQALFLRELGHSAEAQLLKGYISQIKFQDATNREGHAAKVYFNAVFGMDFSRRGDHPFNAALNYGYSILLSAFNREIVACGPDGTLPCIDRPGSVPQRYEGTDYPGQTKADQCAQRIGNHRKREADCSCRNWDLCTQCIRCHAGGRSQQAEIL